MKKLILLNIHILFFLLVIGNYLLSFYLFGSFVFASKTDLLESEILYNKILGQIFVGDFYILDSLLDGDYKWFYFTRIFYIINFFYSFLPTETAYLTLDFLVKAFAYIVFFNLIKKINKNNYYSFILAALYSFSITNTPTNFSSSVFGFGCAAIPYIFYLCIKNKKLKIRNYFFLIFAALNSHFYFALNMIFLLFFVYFYKNKIYFNLIAKIFTIFIFFCILANSNLLYIALFNEIPFNRDIWVKDYHSLSNNLKSFFINLFYFPVFLTDIEINNNVYKKIIYLPAFVDRVPLTIFYTLNFILLILKKINRNLLFFISIIFILAVSFFEQTKLFTNFSNDLNLSIIKSISLHRIKIFLTFIVLFSLGHLFLNRTFSKKIYLILLFSLFLFQINKITIPYIKDKINYSNLSIKQKNELKENLSNFNIFNSINLLKMFGKTRKENREIVLSFKDYYDEKNFLFIKNIVKDDYVLPLDIDPAKLTFNNIKVLGGLYQFYPQSYKINFREIISEELDQNDFEKNYFDKMGHRLYAFVKNPDNVKIDFSKAKLMKAKYVLSFKRLKNSNLIIICEKCNFQLNLNLYKIK